MSPGPSETLPSPTRDYSGVEVKVSGWGHTDPRAGHGRPTCHLREAWVRVLEPSHRHCTTTMSIQPPLLLCAADPAATSDTCLGDSGGPMVALEEGRWGLPPPCRQTWKKSEILLKRDFSYPVFTQK